MTEKIEIEDNEPCGCGSGRKYRRCCKGPRRQYVRNGRGSISKRFLLDDSGVKAFEDARDDFIKHFGRQPARRDRAFTGPYRHSPQDFDRMFYEAARATGTPGHLIYAYKATGGLLLSQSNLDLVSPADRADWELAAEEYLSALEDGVDLLEPTLTPLDEALTLFEEIIETAVIHLGNYVDRAPRIVKTHLPTFFQFLLISRCHQVLKSFADSWTSRNGDESYAVFRTLYECALIIQRLDVEPSYSDTLLAQALAGSPLYPFRVKKNGKKDYSKIISNKDGNIFEARTSFAECAHRINEDNLIFFDIVYPILSSQIHFHSGEMIRKFQETGSFLIWQEPRAEYQALYGLVSITYLIIAVALSLNVTKTTKRDALFLIDKLDVAFQKLVNSIEQMDKQVDPSFMLTALAARELFLGRSLNSFKEATGHPGRG